MSADNPNTLAAFLEDRRNRLDPAAFGFSGRRRTPGLRRQEVTWLEQGRGGAPSADVLDRIAAGLMLTDVEREHMFVLALGRPPEIRYKPASGVTDYGKLPVDQRNVLRLFFFNPVIRVNQHDWKRNAPCI